MTTITYVQPGGARLEVDASLAETVMLVAVGANVRGIDADCGGNCSCATCHVYVDAAWTERVEPPTPDEMMMLDEVAAERRPSSRLCCQIRVTADLDGLVVHVADRQY